MFLENHDKHDFRHMSTRIISGCVPFSSELERRVRDGVYTEGQDDKSGGMAP